MVIGVRIAIYGGRYTTSCWEGSEPHRPGPKDSLAASYESDSATEEGSVDNQRTYEGSRKPRDDMRNSALSQSTRRLRLLTETARRTRKCASYLPNPGCRNNPSAVQISPTPPSFFAYRICQEKQMFPPSFPESSSIDLATWRRNESGCTVRDESIGGGTA
ncbi:hypothetical protein BDY19DRAFT_287229 [Irpex rosettiformis]|uniref:Uncharacterized protein n=1 Tax=Irpex rosettiformis TaxID=378272 RepID=A0ACB8UHZ1_9APHY|nr:hypothetical protein BDY19DRAFT_287229 [Irpex rosettiformis]